MTLNEISAQCNDIFHFTDFFSLLTLILESILFRTHEMVHWHVCMGHLFLETFMTFQWQRAILSSLENMVDIGQMHLDAVKAKQNNLPYRVTTSNFCT